MDQRGRTGEGLQREEPANPTQEDAEHWLDLYGRLIAFTSNILDQTRAVMETMPDPGVRHLESTNVRILVEELDMFEQRRRVWTERLRELSDRAGSTG